MRILFLIVVTVSGIIASFYNAFYGLLLYTFYSFAHPLMLVGWTSFETYRPSLIVAIVVIATTIMQNKKIIIKHKLTFLCILFLGQCYLSLLIRGEDMSYSSSYFIGLLSRTLLITFITSSLIEDFSKLKMYMMASAVFLGLLGAYYGFFGLLAGATSIVGNLSGDNNAYSTWLNMSLPVIYYVGMALRDKRWRTIAKIIFAGNVLAVLLTFSRAGSLTLCVILVILTLHKMRKILLFIIIPIGVIALFFLAPNSSTQYGERWEGNETAVKQVGVAGSKAENVKEAYKARMETLRQPLGEIDSGKSRIHFWVTAIHMANANPIFGVGFQRYMDEYNNYDNTYGFFGGARALHNTILQTLAEMGYVGFLLFAAIIVNFFLTIEASKRRVKRCMEEDQEKKEFTAYLNALSISMVAFIINSSFVNCLYFETLWAFIGVAIAVDNITKKFDQQEIVLQADTNG